MRPVHPLRINPVELTHAICQVPLRRFDDQVVMVGHQAIRMANPVKPRANLGKQRQPGLAVSFREINILAPVTPRGNVVQTAG